MERVARLARQPGGLSPKTTPGSPGPPPTPPPGAAGAAGGPRARPPAFFRGPGRAPPVPAGRRVYASAGAAPPGAPPAGRGRPAPPRVDPPVLRHVPLDVPHS